MSSHLIRGSVLEPVLTESSIYICHVVNNLGRWGAGFSGNLSRVWKKPERVYRSNWKETPLGDHQLCLCGETPSGYPIFVVNLMAQIGLRSSDNPVPFSLLHFREALEGLLVDDPASFHFPYGIGSGLGGGDRREIHRAIEEILKGQEIYFYSLGEKGN